MSVTLQPNVPVPSKAVGATPAGTAPAGNVPAAAGPKYMQVRQMQADGKYKVVWMATSAMSAAELARAKVNGLNGAVAATTPAPAPTAATPNPAAPVAQPSTASWVPDQIGLTAGMVNQQTGQVDWSGILAKVSQIAAADPEYAQSLSNNIAQAMSSLSPYQAEIDGLTAVNPKTGRNQYQQAIVDNDKSFGEGASSAFGNAAVRGIGSSGLVNSNLAKLAITKEDNASTADKTLGGTRIAQLIGNMNTGLLGENQNFGASYYAALARANGQTPTIADPTKTA